MPRPGVGNPGNKGGGRRSAYEEKQDAEWHAFVWESEQDIDVLEKKIQSKKYSGREIAALRLLKGDKFLIGKFMDKLVPDLHEVKSQTEISGLNGGEIPVTIKQHIEDFEMKIKKSLLDES